MDKMNKENRPRRWLVEPILRPVRLNLIYYRLSLKKRLKSGDFLAAGIAVDEIRFQLRTAVGAKFAFFTVSLLCIVIIG